MLWHEVSQFMQNKTSVNLLKDDTPFTILLSYKFTIIIMPNACGLVVRNNTIIRCTNILV